MASKRLLYLFGPLLASGCGAFIPSGVTRVGGADVPRLAASVATWDDLEVIVPSIVEEASVSFFGQQLDICRSIVDDGDASLQPERRGEKGRARFKEHPRCTARFGEVLLHARNCAASDDEYRIAVHNAKSVVIYVERCREESNGSHPIREGLVADVVAALTSKSLRQFRIRQIQEDTQTRGSDFTPEAHDLEVVGRLYYSSIRSTEIHLEEVGLTPDHAGFTALLALCRAAASHTAADTVLDDASISISEEEARLDVALSNHFNGITAPGCRFLFSRRHGVDEPNVVGRAKRLIVAFSSLGNGLVRHEFGGSLAKLNQQLHRNGEEPFDVFFVADPSQSWYQKCSRGRFDGFGEYERRIRVASKPYEKVSMVGDSMGGSGALLFSHLATDAVVAFSPQVDIEGDGHVSRYDMTPDVRERFWERLLCSFDGAAGAKVKVFVHRGLEEADVRHTDLLMSRLPEASTGVEIIEHGDCNHHQVATHLKKKGQLAQVLSCNLIEERQ